MPLSRQNEEMGKLHSHNPYLHLLDLSDELQSSLRRTMFSSSFFLFLFKNIYETHLGDTANKTVT